MPVSTLPPATPEPDAPTAPKRSWTVGRVATVVTVLALVAFWIWILSGAPKRTNPDWVSDRGLIASISRDCKRTVKAMDALPAAADTHSAGVRADVIDQATTKVEQLVDRIEASAPSTGDDAVRLRGWVKDWRTYTGDRRDYARRLRHHPRAAFLLDVNRAGDSVDRAITNFADINDIPSCDAPGDVG